MSPLLYVLSFFWAIVAIKAILFWIFLWQLKSYHTGRLRDHFRTDKGKKIFLSLWPVAKFILLCALLASDQMFWPVFWILLLAYTAEAVIFIKNLLKHQAKLPAVTFKTILLTAMLVIFTSLFFWRAYRLASLESNSSFIISLLLFDIFLPLIVSVAVLLIQPFFVIVRWRTLKKAAKKMKQFPDVKVIGITGSYGKTTTKEFLTTILSAKFNVLKTLDHKNSEMGIAKTILEKLDENHQVFVVEMGAYNKGGIKLLCDMVKPSIGIVTGVNQQHLATFGSLENLLSAEGGQELVNNLPKDGTIIVNGDNAYCLDLYQKTQAVDKKIYSLHKNKISSDLWTEDLEIHQNSISFIARAHDNHMAHINVDVLGGHNIQNMLGAILAAKTLGMDIHEIATACKQIKQVQAGITLKKGAYGINVVDSSYSSNPDGVLADLEYMKVFKGKRVVVMPCLIELGNASGTVHYNIGKKIAEICDLAIITTKDQFANIKKGALENGMVPKHILLCDKPSEIITHITTFCKEGDAVLLEGRVPGELIKLLQ